MERRSHILLATHRSARAAVWAFLCLLPLVAGAQGIAINADGAAPDPAAVLDVDATALPANGKKGVLLPEVELSNSIWRLPAPMNTATYAHYFSPFDTHGQAAMWPSTWVYNSMTSPTGGMLPFTIPSPFNTYYTTPGFYWWSDAGGRWHKQETQVGTTHHHLSTATVTATSDINSTAVLTDNTNWVAVTGASTAALALRAGDRVDITAHGALAISPTNSNALAAARVAVNNGATTTEIGRTGVALNGEAQPMYSGWCFLPPLFCSGNTLQGTYTTNLTVQDWHVVRQYVVPADGTYTFLVQIGRVTGTSISLIGGGTVALNPDLRTSLKVEVFRP